MDGATAALLGALVGGAGVIGAQIVASIGTSKQQERALQQAVDQGWLTTVGDTYEFVLQHLTNEAQGSRADRASRGHMVAKVNLYGSGQVREWFRRYEAMPVRDRRPPGFE